MTRFAFVRLPDNGDAQFGDVAFTDDDLPNLLYRASVWLQNDASVHGSQVHSVAVERDAFGQWELRAELRRESAVQS
jgi:hypothetical protein